MSDEIKKLDLASQILNLDGTPVWINEEKQEALTLGVALANILVLEKQSRDPLRSYLLAKKLTENKGEVELDKSESGFLKEVVEASQSYITLVKGQLLEKLS